MEPALSNGHRAWPPTSSPRSGPARPGRGGGLITPFCRIGSTSVQVRSDLVLVNVSVTDSRGTPITDLDVSRFHRAP